MLEGMNGWVKRDLAKFEPDYLKPKDIRESIHELELVYDD